MTHVDIYQAQKYLQQQAQSPARRLRRQLVWAVLLVLAIAGYASCHAVPGLTDAAHAIPRHAKVAQVFNPAAPN